MRADFYFSAAPLVSIIEEFCKNDLETDSPGRSSWIPTAFHAGGVPYEVLFEAYDGLYRSRVIPWETQAAASFLLPSIASILTNWLKETTVQGYSTNAGYGNFPVNEVELAVSRYIADSGSDLDGRTKEQLQDVLREIRRRF